MARKAPTDEQVQALLRAENFDPGIDLPITGELPVTPTMMRLPIDQISTYERNPRKATHQKFEELVQSIIDKGGVINPISVTKRPGDDQFFVSAGGNTRLLAQKEAWERTRDNRLEKMNVMFNPFTDEANIVVDHLIENDMRSDNTFLEKAQAVYVVMEGVQGENPDRVISQRQWPEILKERYGYTVSRSALLRYLYALEKLYPFLPQALEAGMAVRQAEEIRKLETRVRKYAEAMKVVESRMDLAFQQALRACDTSDGFTVAAVETALCSQLGMMTGVTPEDFEAGLVRFESGITGVRPAPAGRSAPELVISNDQPTLPSIHASPDRMPPVRTADEREGRDWGGAAAGHPDVQMPETSGNTSTLEEPLTLSQRREAAFKHAQSIAETVMIRDCIKPLAAGYGFYVEVPTTTLIHPDEIIQRAVIW